MTFPKRATELGFKKFILIKYGYMQYSIFLVLCILCKHIAILPLIITKQVYRLIQVRNWYSLDQAIDLFIHIAIHIAV